MMRQLSPTTMVVKVGSLMAELGGSQIEEDAAKGTHFDVLAESPRRRCDLRLHYRY
jgi:hypothetical protein